MKTRVVDGKKIVSCKDMQDNLHKMLLDLDELMQELKILEIPESKRRQRTSIFRDVMSAIFKLNGLDYEIWRMMDTKGIPLSSAGIMITNDLKRGLKEACEIVTKADEFLAEYR